jgi:hypothetical protein
MVTKKRGSKKGGGFFSFLGLGKKKTCDETYNECESKCSTARTKCKAKEPRKTPEISNSSTINNMTGENVPLDTYKMSQSDQLGKMGQMDQMRVTTIGGKRSKRRRSRRRRSRRR